MAVVFEGFSIREYAAKMRSVDVGKCWPFGEIDKEDIEPLLPPITVTKFRWWSNELELLTSMESSGVEENPHGDQAIIPRNDYGDFVADDEGLEEEVEQLEEETETFDMVCPVCGGFTAATVNALNAHVDSCLAQASREERRQMRLAMKGKSRAPKKRSIVEIFAVSQQIEKVDGENLDEEACQEELNVKIGRKMKKKMKKVKVVNKLIKKKRKKKKKTLKNGLSGKNKLQENTNKLKVQTSVKFTRELNDSLCNKGFTKEVLDSVTVHGKKRHMKYFSQKKHKFLQASKLTKKHQEPVIPVQGILKKYKKDIPGQNATVCSLQGDNQVDPCGIQPLDRHVRFSGEDDILGPRKRSFSSSKKSICNLYLDAFASSSERDQSMVSEKEFATRNGMIGDVVSISTEDGTGMQSMVEKDLFPHGHDRVDVPNFLRPHNTSQEKLKHLSEKSVSLSQVSLHDDDLQMFDRGNQITSCKPPYSGIPKLLSALNEVRNPYVNSQVHGTISRASDSGAKLIDYFENYSQGIDGMSSMANTRGFQQPSSSGFTLNGISSARLPSAGENMIGHALRPSSHLSTMEPRGSLCPFPEWTQRAVSFRQNCINEEFFGWPLNSQGELIQASSHGNGSFNQFKKTSLVSGSSSWLPVDNFDLQRSLGDSSRMKERHFVERILAKDQLHLFSGENYVKENPNFHLPARLGVAELPVSVKDDVHWLNSRSGGNHSKCLLDSDQNLMNAFNGIRQYDQLQNKERNRAIHPKENSDLMPLNTTQLTMRLMGKDVAISRSSKEMQGFPDGKVWTDKEIIAEHHTLSTARNNLSAERRFQEDCPLNPASGKSNESLEIQNNDAPLSDTLINAPDSGLFHPYVNWESNAAVFQSGILPSSRHGTKPYHIAYPPTFPAIFHSENNLQEPFMPGPEILGVNSQLPSVSTTHINQHMDWRPAELNYKQSFSQATKSTFNFPFLHPDCSEPVQPSSSRSSSKSLLPWLLQATQGAKTPMTPFQPFYDMNHRYYPYTTEMNLLPTPSVHQPSVAYPFNPLTSQSHMQSSLGPASVAHSFAPALSGIRPTSSIDMSYGNRNKVLDRMQSNFFEFKGLNHLQKTKKRPASREDYSTMHTKKPNVGIQEDLSTVTELTREDYSRNIEGNAGASELNSSRDRTSSSRCGLSGKQDDVSALAVLERKNLSQEMQHDHEQLELDSNRIEASGIGCIPNENQRAGARTSANVDPSRVDGMARSGPLKLSAGAKHIFKPSENMDQDNSKLVHSTIPFAAAPDTNILLEFQKKSTKIYRF